MTEEKYPILADLLELERRLRPIPSVLGFRPVLLAWYLRGAKEGFEEFVEEEAEKTGKSKRKIIEEILDETPE